MEQPSGEVDWVYLISNRYFVFKIVWGVCVYEKEREKREQVFLSYFKMS